MDEECIYYQHPISIVPTRRYQAILFRIILSACLVLCYREEEGNEERTKIYLRDIGKFHYRVIPTTEGRRDPCGLAIWRRWGFIA
jgi:hypothetical protein